MTGSEKEAPERPLSPHMQIYRWPISMATSIFHRATGVANAAGMVLITFWLVALAMGSDTYKVAQEVLSSPFGRLILFGFTVSLVYHLANGIRHLMWDTGRGYELGTARASGIFVFVFTALATIAIWVTAYMMGGAFA